MKQICHTPIIPLALLLIISITSARLPPSHQGDNLGRKANEITQQEDYFITQQEDDFSSLMGLEVYGDKAEASEKRRMMSEAHLDYIYTQHHHP